MLIHHSSFIVGLGVFKKFSWLYGLDYQWCHLQHLNQKLRARKQVNPSMLATANKLIDYLVYFGLTTTSEWVFFIQQMF